MKKSPSTRIAACLLLSAGVAALSGCGNTQTSQSLVADARQYQSKGDTKAAVIQLKNALQKNPDDVDARFLLGTIYLDTGDVLSAEKELDKAISLGMSRDKVLPLLGKAYVQSGKYQQALDAVPPSADGKASADMLTVRGAAQLALGKNAEAKASFEAALRAKPDSVDALVGLIQYASANNDAPAAMQYANQALSAHPDSVPVLMLKGELLRAAGKGGEAMTIYDQVLKLKPGTVPALTGKATIDIGNGKFESAQAYMDTARKIAPNALMVYYTQALLDYTRGKYTSALESLQQILRVAPDNLPSLLLAGATQAAAGANAQAEQYLRTYVAAKPDNLYARKLLGSVLTKSGQPEQAMRVLTPAISSAGADPQLLLLAGENSMHAKDYAKATEYFERANKLSPQTSVVHTALAMSNLGQGDSSKAISELELATSLSAKSAGNAPDNAILLVMTRMRLGQFKEALASLKTLEKQQPQNPLVFNLEGGAYMGLKDRANARGSFVKAITLQPTFLPAAQNLAQLDLQENKPEEAKKRFTDVLEKDKKNIGAMTALASLAMTSGKPDEATSWLERASNENPEVVAPAVQLGTHYLRLGRKANALALAQKLQSTNPSNPDVLDLLAQAQFENGDKTGALATYNKVVAAAPTSPLAQYRLASIELAMQDIKAAAASLNKAIALQPDYLEAQLTLSTLTARQGNIDGALSIARQIQKQRAKEPVGYMLEGDLLVSQKKMPPAVVAFEKAAARSKNPDVLIKLHQAMIAAGHAKEADARLAKEIQERPDELAIQIYQGEIYLAKKMIKQAISVFERVQQKAPNNPVLLNNLAYAYQQDKDSRALATAEKAAQAGPEIAAVLDTLGWSLSEQGNTERALPVLQKAVLLSQKDPAGSAAAQNIRYHLARTMLRAGDKAGARKELEGVIASGKVFPELDDAKALLKTL
ncbi:MAG: PEP-CTERM system TPR-repeat protein PrsT [Burkholderiaceae bacterium]